MEHVNIYTYTAEAKSKEYNLLLRSKIFESYYLPYLVKLGLFKKGDNCIELGCGQGHKLKVLIDNFPDVKFIGMDCSDLMLAKANQKLPGVSLIKKNIINMTNCIDDLSQDIVCLFQVLHHNSKEDRIKIYKEALRILKPNGHLIVIASFRPGTNKIKQALWDIEYKFYAVLSQYPTKLLSNRMKEAIMSILQPSKYNSEDFGYFSIENDGFLGEITSEFKLVEFVNPKVLGIINSISDLVVFQKQ